MLTVIETFEHAGRISLLAAAAVLPIPATGQHDSGVLHTWPAGLVSVQLTGAVIVSGNDPHATYFLDNDEDEVADYRLVFGPSWYEPDSGASRPSHGDTVTIVGSVNDHDATPRLVVFELNGERWRASVEYGMHGWNAMPFWTEQGDTLTASGTVQVDTTYFYHHYYLDTDADGRPEYELGLGPLSGRGMASWSQSGGSFIFGLVLICFLYTSWTDRLGVTKVGRHHGRETGIIAHMRILHGSSAPTIRFSRLHSQLGTCTAWGCLGRIPASRSSGGFIQTASQYLAVFTMSSASMSTLMIPLARA
jgi:hypothetical protein